MPHTRLLAEKYEQELTQSTFLPAERQKACRNLLKEYFSSLCKHLLRDHKELKNMDKQNRKILQVHIMICDIVFLVKILCFNLKSV